MIKNHRPQVPSIPAISKQTLRDVKRTPREEQSLWLPNFALRQSQLFVHLGSVAELRLPWDRDRDEVRPLMEELAFGYAVINSVATEEFEISKLPYVTNLLRHMEVGVVEQEANGGRGLPARFETRQPVLHQYFNHYAAQEKQGLDKPQQEFVIEAAAFMFHALERQLRFNGVGQLNPASSI